MTHKTSDSLEVFAVANCAAQLKRALLLGMVVCSSIVAGAAAGAASPILSTPSAEQAPRAQITWVVDDDGHGSPADCDDSTPSLTTVAAGIAAAASGDTVLVCPGTYVENINFGGKAIIVRR